MRDRGQRGATLMLVLVLVAFLSILVPAFLALAFTGSRATVPVVEDRRELYAAGSALDAAIEQGRVDWVGRVGTTCPTQTLEINGFDTTVDCESTTRWCDLDRSLVYTAVVRDDTTAVVGTATAEVVFRFDPTGTPEVDVRRWSPGATGPPATSTTVPCTGASSTTTTTIDPAATMTATWRVGDLRAVKENNSGTRWRAEGPVEVVDSNGAPVVGATVAVRVEYLAAAGWQPVDDLIEGETVETGRATFHSGYFRAGPHPNQPWAERIRLTIVSVEAAGSTWVPGTVVSPELLAVDAQDP